MHTNDIRVGERYVIRHDNQEIPVKVIARCEAALHSWMCERKDKVKLIVAAEAFVRSAHAK